MTEWSDILANNDVFPDDEFCAGAYRCGRNGAVILSVRRSLSLGRPRIRQDNGAGYESLGFSLVVGLTRSSFGANRLDRALLFGAATFAAIRIVFDGLGEWRRM